MHPKCIVVGMGLWMDIIVANFNLSSIVLAWCTAAVVHSFVLSIEQIFCLFKEAPTEKKYI